MIYGTILSFHMIPVDTNARLYRRMNEADTNYSETLLHAAVSPRSTGEEAVLCLGWRGHGSGYFALSGDLSPEKSAEIKSVQPSLSQDIHIIAANVGTGSPVSSALHGLDSPAGSIYLH